MPEPERDIFKLIFGVQSPPPEAAPHLADNHVHHHNGLGHHHNGGGHHYTGHHHNHAQLRSKHHFEADGESETLRSGHHHHAGLVHPHHKQTQEQNHETKLHHTGGSHHHVNKAAITPSAESYAKVGQDKLVDAFDGIPAGDGFGQAPTAELNMTKIAHHYKHTPETTGDCLGGVKQALAATGINLDFSGIKTYADRRPPHNQVHFAKDAGKPLEKAGFARAGKMPLEQVPVGGIVVWGPPTNNPKDEHRAGHIEMRFAEHKGGPKEWRSDNNQDYSNPYGKGNYTVYLPRSVAYNDAPKSNNKVAMGNHHHQHHQHHFS
jgi:hypothetical protein